MTLRRGGRAVDGTGLENRQGVKAFEGSNPSLSARREVVRQERILRIIPLSPPGECCIALLGDTLLEKKVAFGSQVR